MRNQGLASIKMKRMIILPGLPVTVPEEGLNPLAFAEALK